MNEVDVKKLVVKSAVRVVNVEGLQVDPSYQREVKSKHKKIVAEFNENALGVPLIGERTDGSLWIVDGQQRITALGKLGKDRVRVEVFASQGPEHEAEIFKLVNLNRTRLTPMEEFKALLTAHDEDAWTIKNAVESCGLRIALNTKRGGSPSTSYLELNCINTLRRTHQKYGVESIKFALNTAKEAWPNDGKGFHNCIVAGFCAFYKQYEGMVDMEKFMPRLQTVTPHAIMYAAGQAVLSNNKESAVVDQLEKVYRKRLSSKKGS